MDIILTHNHMDFDALSSLVAASKLHEEAAMVLPKQQNDQVQQFLAIYRDSFPFLTENEVNWEDVHHVILTDVNTLRRTVAHQKNVSPTTITVYDHHPLSQDERDDNITYFIEPVGAATTILLEKIIEQNIEITAIEATLFALGLYSDTGSFTYPSTTARDFQAALFLMEQGMQLEIVQRFFDETLSASAQRIFQHYLANAKSIELDGLEIVISTHSTNEFVGNLNVITNRVLETLGIDAIFTITEMKNKVFIIGRSASERIDVLPLIKQVGGGGHRKAASASIKQGDMETIIRELKQHMKKIIRPSITAELLMSSPVKTITDDTTIDDAKELMLRYGHNGLPIVNQKEEIVGIISRRDIDKATRHGLGHAPVKGYMSPKPITVSRTTPFEKMQQLMIQYNIGRLPVVEEQKVVGIVSRTDIIEEMHRFTSEEKEGTKNIRKEMEKWLTPETLAVVKKAGELATKKNVKAYMIGGIVRDLLLNRPNEDIDVVIEGDAISFAIDFAKQIDGTVHQHESFRTATVETKEGISIDFTTSRTEYYEKPAALPTVLYSNIKEDLSRRDFTLNAIAASILPDTFGDVLDYFHGVEDIENKRLQVLHNLSFIEDPTRILRGIRFEARYSFRMSQETEALIENSLSSIASLSKERIQSELKIVFQETDPIWSMNRLNELGVLPYFLPHSAWNERTRATLQYYLEKERVTDAEDDFFYIICSLYVHDDKRLSQLKNILLTKKHRRVVQELMTLYKNSTSFHVKSAGAFHDMCHSYVDITLIMAVIAFMTGDKEQQRIGSLLRQYHIKRKNLQRFVTGEDLKKAGIPPGPLYKHIFFELEKAIIDEKVYDQSSAFHYIHEHLLQNSK
ncbi:CBS domain-containing protein [Aliibacillus thermotolerans]|uniref:CBS domain-containing protein n=1 Tax=Aliibacillus thermotolerans TaxID=1834418 RepID=A0ABW0U534_9BACI|nr:CBS domain-containing protein [Aliibacillus thermotolerans]MDA3129167.1 CBS domain-containing protein [Aliibacillus thermotolerans]